MADKQPRSIDPATECTLELAAQREIRTVWDRYDAMQPQCGFGKLGICCRVCNMGPCRIDPFGDGATVGVCGATADTIAARNLARMIASGAAAHSDHGRDVAHTMLLMAKGEAKDYQVKHERKLRDVAGYFGIEGADGKDVQKLALEVAEAAYAQFGQQEGELTLLQRAPKRRQDLWRKLGLWPRGIDREVVEIMHRTHMGVDTDYRNIIMHGIRAALADGWGGSMIGTDLQDIMLGCPTPIRAKVNLGVLGEDKVNIVVHGHEPILSDMIVEASRDPELLKLAEEKGATGIQLAGICCTANEVLMRQGVPSAGNFLQQEVAIATGAVEAMIVDVQCLMPSLDEVSNCFHTKLITTSPKAKMPGVEHIEFDERRALDIAKQIVRTAIENFPNRKPELVSIPQDSMDLVAGFTAEYVFEMLGGRFRSSYRPLNDAIITGRIRGVAGVVGCCNPNVLHESCHIGMVKELIKHDVLVVQTGCSAVTCAKHGLLQPEAAVEYAGKGLQEVCEAVGMPPVLHVGSCVDNSRILIACCEMVKEGGLGEDISDLPVAGAAPEWMSEKAVAIGMYVVGSGIFTVFGTPLPVLGSQAVTDFLCGDELEDMVGARWAFEVDPIKAAHLMMDHIEKKRAALKLRPMMYPSERDEKKEAAAA
ncbi:MAG: anaerobic carbon-monoxide dehydrogenase catalytic subunit [Armatimonadota bacterium]|nr:MAG: anaerobic carbon-monoxide dehydrogenase catalytic subunit [Armatimonadota bacterium]